MNVFNPKTGVMNYSQQVRDECASRTTTQTDKILKIVARLIRYLEKIKMN